MTLAELNTPFQRKKIITYGSDHCTAVYHNKELQHITGSIYKGRNKVDTYGQLSCRIYVFFEKLNVGIDLLEIPHPDYFEVEKIENSIINDYKMDSPENFILDMESRVERRNHIGNAMIQLASHIKPERVEIYRQARLDYRAMKDKEATEHKEKCKQKEILYCQEQNQKSDEQIKLAIQTIKNKGKLLNSEISIYSSRYTYSTYRIINHLMKMFDIKVPIKTQGWINDALYDVEMINDIYSYQYYKKNNDSKVFKKYLTILVEKILAA